MLVEVRVHLQKSLQGTLDKAKSGLDQACQIFTHHDRQELAISRHAIVRGKKPYITYRVYPCDDDPLREEIPVRMLEVF